MTVLAHTRSLLVVTVDGYAKRVPLDDIPVRRRNTKGVVLSSVPIAAVLKVDGSETLLIATKRGKIERVAVSEIPERRRRVQSGGRVAKGAAVLSLAEGDRVVSAALASDDPAAVAQCLPDALGEVDWPWGTSGLNPGERIVDTAVLLPPHPLEAISPGGRMAVSRDEWAKTEIHKASSYSCAHRGQQYEHPEDVCACIDGHLALVAPRPLAVGPSQVVQLVEASCGRLVAEGAVWSAMVVGPEPAVKGAGAFGA